MCIRDSVNRHSVALREWRRSRILTFPLAPLVVGALHVALLRLHLGEREVGSGRRRHLTHRRELLVTRVAGRLGLLLHEHRLRHLDDLWLHLLHGIDLLVDASPGVLLRDEGAEGRR